MKIYIAAPWELKDDAYDLGYKITELGPLSDMVVSRWFERPPTFSVDHPIDQLITETAEIDRAELRLADTFIALCPETWHGRGTGGRHVEFGIAIERGLKLIVIGKKSNVYYYLPGVIHFNTPEDFLEYYKNSPRRLYGKDTGHAPKYSATAGGKPRPEDAR